MADDIISGAIRVVALAAAGRDASLSDLPRLLRHALRPIDNAARALIAAEIAVVAPTLGQEATSWSLHPGTPSWRPLATSLDELAVKEDTPTLHGLADAVRLTSMTVAEVCELPDQALRLARSLHAAKRVAGRAGVDASTLADVERCSIGWMALATRCVEPGPTQLRSGHSLAFEIGSDLTEAIETVLEIGAQGEAKAGTPCLTDAATPDPARAAVQHAHVMVCPPIAGRDRSLTEVVRAHAHVVGVGLPLTAAPDMASVLRTLSEEYPYALAAIDRLLVPLTGACSVRLPPTLLVGPPGSGKSRLARRLAELLGTCLWRTDAARSDNSSFGGTDRRWATAESCHPFLAVSRSRTANPFVLIDEVDKAGVGRHNGRLWDALLGFLEPETSRAYPDPQLQVELDLSHVAFVMTCNEVGGLPSPLLDRCRVVQVPAPLPCHLDALLPSVMCGIAADDGLDERWVEPLTSAERSMVARHWRGGSVRHLSRLVAAVVRARARSQPIH
ncbi:AAA family ATPase [Lichenibacterium dinghuense]|uniref:AAA family ATPase n=1 Tax=Lichenibacterium dinghuense TaxID=2895977 RepID=UPI001F02C17B|nr:AAA family ATPase [Lichenibacterium sp. 6Y81]